MNERSARREQPSGKGKGARRAGTLAAIIFLSLVTLVALTFCVFLLLRIEVMQDEEKELQVSVDQLHAIEAEGYMSEADAFALVQSEREKAEKETTSHILQWIRDQFAEGTSSAWMLRNLYGTFSDELVVGANGTFHFFARKENLKPTLIQPDDIRQDENGVLNYIGSDPRVSGALGIDVSRFQGKINWKKVAAEGVKFAFIRVGSRGSSEGKMLEDSQFVTNIEGAQENGISVGVYFYTQAINEEEAVEEAEYCIDCLRPYEIDLPVVYDFEPSDSGDSRISDLSSDQCTRNVLAFCSRIEQAGYQPMLYGGIRGFIMMLDLEQLEHIKKWYAFYDSTPYLPYEYSYWQYSDKGHIDGIEGSVDLDICIEDLSK